MRDGPSVKQATQPEKQEVPGLSWESLGSPREFPGSTPWECFRTPGSLLASLEAVAGLEEAGQVLMPAPPRRPGQNQAKTGGHDRFGWVVSGLQQSGGGVAGGERDTGQKCQSQHDQGDMAIPAHQA